MSILVTLGLEITDLAPSSVNSKCIIAKTILKTTKDPVYPEIVCLKDSLQHKRLVEAFATESKQILVVGNLKSGVISDEAAKKQSRIVIQAANISLPSDITTVNFAFTMGVFGKHGEPKLVGRGVTLRRAVISADAIIESSNPDMEEKSEEDLMEHWESVGNACQLSVWGQEQVDMLNADEPGVPCEAIAQIHGSHGKDGAVYVQLNLLVLKNLPDNRNTFTREGAISSKEADVSALNSNYGDV